MQLYMKCSFLEDTALCFLDEHLRLDVLPTNDRCFPPSSGNVAFILWPFF